MSNEPELDSGNGEYLSAQAAVNGSLERDDHQLASAFISDKAESNRISKQILCILELSDTYSGLDTLTSLAYKLLLHLC